MPDVEPPVTASDTGLANESELDAVDTVAMALVQEIAAVEGRLDLMSGVSYELRPLIAKFAHSRLSVRPLVRVDGSRHGVAVVAWPYRDSVPAHAVVEVGADGAEVAFPALAAPQWRSFDAEATTLIRHALVEMAVRLSGFQRALADSPLATGRLCALTVGTWQARAGADFPSTADAVTRWKAARTHLAEAEDMVVKESGRVSDLVRRALDDAALIPMRLEDGPYGIRRVVVRYRVREGLRRRQVEREVLVLAYEDSPLEPALRHPDLGDPVDQWNVNPAHAARFLIDAGYLLERIERVIVHGPLALAQAQRLSAIRLADPTLADRIARRLALATGTTERRG